MPGFISNISRSNIRGFLLPALGLSDWKHDGVVELYSRIGGQGYTLLYLTNRAIGQSDMTREYINSISENQYKMPEGPICKSLSTEYCNIVYLDWIFPPNIYNNITISVLQVDSLLGAFQTEVRCWNFVLWFVSMVCFVPGHHRPT